MSRYRVIYLLMYIAMTVDTSTPKSTTIPSNHFFQHTSKHPPTNLSVKDDFIASISHPNTSESKPSNAHQSKKSHHGLRFKKLKKNGIVVFRPYNFTVEKMSSDSIRIRWQRNLKRYLGPRTTFSIKVLPYKTKQYFEAHITDITNNIVLHGLSPETQYNLVVSQNNDILLNKSLLVGEERMSPTTQETMSPTNSTLYYHPSPTNKVRVEEIVIVTFILVLWICAISLFVHRWGKIRMLVPHQPPYAEVVPSDQSKALVSGSRHNLASLDPNHPNFTSVCSSSNYSATAAAVKAAGVGTTIGICTHRPPVLHAPPPSSSILMACERARLWRARSRLHQRHNNHHTVDDRQNSILSENNEMYVASGSRRVQSALDLRESFKNKSSLHTRPESSSRQNSFRQQNKGILKSESSEQDGNNPSTIVVISGVHSDIKMSVLNDSKTTTPQVNATPTTKDTQV